VPLRSATRRGRGYKDSATRLSRWARVIVRAVNAYAAQSVHTVDELPPDTMFEGPPPIHGSSAPWRKMKDEDCNSFLVAPGAAPLESPRSVVRRTRREQPSPSARLHGRGLSACADSVCGHARVPTRAGAWDVSGACAGACRVSATLRSGAHENAEPLSLTVGVHIF
jgi:hypothetical protein